jgi:phosphate-selective porin
MSLTVTEGNASREQARAAHHDTEMTQVSESGTRRRMIFWIAVAALLFASDARATNTSQATPSPDNQPPTKARSTDAKKKKKKAGKKDGASEQAEKKPKAPEHPSWSPIPAITLDFKARIESEVRTATPALGLDQGQVEWQDRRIGVEGTAFKRITFEVSRELSEDFEAANGLSEKTAWKDAYVNLRVNKALNIEAGRFKLPFGREETTGETNLDFVHRSLAARVLSPGRDVGIMTHGRLFDRRVSYEAGYFTRDGDNGRTSQTQGGRDAVVARLEFTPFASLANRALAPLEVGVAVADSRIDDRLGVRGRTVLGDGIFFDRVYVNGQRRRIGFDAAWERGSGSASAEYITVSDERKAMGFNGDDLPSVDAKAWYVAGTWAITGERKHGRLEPRRDLLRGGIGAVELSARVEELRFDAATYPGSAFGFPSAAALSGNADRAITLGINWYLNHYVKLQGNLVREWIEDPERSPAPAAGGRFVSPVLLLQFRF